MKLDNQKRLAAQMLKCSGKRVKFDTDRLDDIKEAITKVDIRGLIKDKAIIKIHSHGVSRGRARKRLEQRRNIMIPAIMKRGFNNTILRLEQR